MVSEVLNGIRSRSYPSQERSPLLDRFFLEKIEDYTINLIKSMIIKIFEDSFSRHKTFYNDIEYEHDKIEQKKKK